MRFIKIGSKVLVIQNLTLLFVLVFFVEGFVNEEFQYILLGLIILTGVLIADIVGFSLVAIGFLELSRSNSDESKNYRIAGLGIIGWIAARLYLQGLFIIAFISGNGFGAADQNLFIAIFSISSLCLFISGLSRIHEKYYRYTLINFSVVWMVTLLILLDFPVFLVQLIGLVKVLFLPIFSIYTFVDLHKSSMSMSGDKKYTTDTYPKYQ